MTFIRTGRLIEKRRRYMKRKYYIRGIGVGILFATIVLFTAYCVTGGGKMTDEEIMRRAEELGMVKSGSLLENLNHTAEDASAKDMTEGSATNDTTEDTPVSTDEDTQNTEEVTPTEADASTTAAPQERTVSITVISGMNSWNVATILQDQGVIADASDFDSYLETNGYSDRISTGEYTITVGSDYEAIAKLLTGNQER